MKNCILSRILPICVLALGFIGSVKCQDEPEITKIILPEIRRSGETGRLNCTVTRQGNNPVHWIYAPKQLSISTDNRIDLDENLNSIIDGYLKYDVEKYQSFISGGQLTTYVLVIRRLQPTDAGRYTCQVQIRGTSRTLYKDGEMIVMVPPTIIHSKTTQTKTIKEGDSINMTCEANAYPEPVIKWVRPNGQSLPLPGAPYSYVGKRLELTRLKQDDRGVYRCIADNNVPPAGLYDATLYILFSPRALAVQTSYGQAASRMFDIVLECRIKGNPEPNLQWYQREGETGLIPITNDDRHTVHILISHGQALSISEYWFQLTIINVLANDYGLFICQGQNDLGTDRAEVLLYETSECQGPNCPAEYGTNGGNSLALSSPCLVLHTVLLLLGVLGTVL